MRFKTIVMGERGRVFSAVADFGRLEAWDPFVDRSELVAGTAMEPGATYRLTSIMGLTLDYELVALAPAQRVTYRGGTRRVSSLDTIEVSPLGSATKIEIETHLEFQGWTVVIAPFVLLGVWLGSRVRTLPALRRYVARLG